jgi:hypothetical protein
VQLSCSLYSSDVATGFVSDRRGSIPGKVKTFLFTPQSSDRQLYPCNLLPKGYRLRQGVKAARRPADEMKNSGTRPPLPPLSSLQGQIHVYLCCRTRFFDVILLGSYI